MQEWIAYAQTKTARHKLAKFLKDHADLLESDTPSAVALREASAVRRPTEEALRKCAAPQEEAASQVQEHFLKCHQAIYSLEWL